MGIIGSIRKHSWVAVAIVGVAILAFILGDLTKNNGGIPDVGKVDGATMTSQRYNELLTEAENNYKMQYQTAQVPSEVEMQLRDQVWQQFVEETLLSEQMNKLGLTVSPAELNDMYVGQFIHPAVRQSFTDPQTGVYDIQQVNYWIENFSNIDTMRRRQWVEMEKAVKTDREQQKYNTLLTAGFYMPKAINEKVTSYAAEASNVRVVALPFMNVSDEEAPIADADYKAYYDEHKAEFRIREEIRELEFITFPVNPTAEDLAEIEQDVQKVWNEFQTVSDDELAFFVNAESDRSYDSNYVKASSFRGPLAEQLATATAGQMFAPAIVGNEWMMAKVLGSAVRPDSIRASVIFIANNLASSTITRTDEQASSLADSVIGLLKANRIDVDGAVEQFADDKQNVDMGWQLDGTVYGPLNDKILETPVDGYFKLKDPRGVGYMVVKVTGKTTATKKYRVAVITREIVPSNNTNRAVYNEANRFAGQNRTIAAFDAAAREQNLQVRNAQVFMMDDRMAGVTNARSIVQWAYNEDTKMGAVADQVFECDGMFVVVALKDVYKKGYATLEQARPMIEQQVRLEKKAQILMDRATSAVNAGKDIQSIAVALNAPVDTLDSVAFGDMNLQKFGMEPKVISAIAASKSGLVGPVKGANGVYVVQIDSKMPRQTTGYEGARMAQMYQYKTLRDNRRPWPVAQVLRDAAKIVDQRNKFF